MKGLAGKRTHSCCMIGKINFEQIKHSTWYFINPQTQLKGFAHLFSPLNFMQFDVRKVIANVQGLFFIRITETLLSRA